MKRSGVADLPLHGGRVPAWLADRMATLGTAIAESVLHHYGRAALLSRLSDPFWFQALGSVMGMDWHSSGITTSVMGALKNGLNPRAHELGIYVCGGRGRHSRNTPHELRDDRRAHRPRRRRAGAHQPADRARRQQRRSPTASRSTCTRSSLTADGDWAVVQQGMNEASRLARRYHWHSADGPRLHRRSAHRDRRRARRHDPEPGRSAGRPAQDALLAIARDDPAQTLADGAPPRDAARTTTCAPRDVNEKRLGAVLALAHERDLRDFASFLLLEQLGPRTLQSLALVAEVVHGTPTRFDDPARFSFAHGGKDGHPFPVPLQVYDESIAVLRRALDAAKLGHSDKLDGFARLDAFTRAIEHAARPRPTSTAAIAHERAISPPRRTHRLRRPPRPASATRPANPGSPVFGLDAAPRIDTKSGMTFRVALVVTVLAAATLLAGQSPAKSGLELANIDRAVRPQDDLFRYANGRWLATAEIPTDRVTLGTFAEMAERTDPTCGPSRKSRTLVCAAGSPVRQIGDLYRSATDEVRLAQLGAAPVRPQLDRFSAIRTREAFAFEAGRLTSVMAGGPFGNSIIVDAEDSKRLLVEIPQGGTMLPNRDYYLNTDAASVELRQRYEMYLARLFALAGRDDAAAAARSVPTSRQRWPGFSCRR